MSVIASDAEYYGLAEEDTSNLWIGNRIPAYEVRNNAVFPLEQIALYPILNQSGELVMMAGLDLSREEPGVSISAELVTELRDCITASNTEQMAILYDKGGAHFWDGESATRIAYSNVEISRRDNLASVGQSTIARQVATSTLQKVETLQVAPSMDTYDLSGSIYLHPPAKQQPEGSYWCWAACMASVIEYRDPSISLEASDIAEKYSAEFDEGAILSVVSDRLHDFGIYYNEYSASGDVVNLEYLGNSLLLDDPAIAESVPDDSFQGHAIVIQGINFDANIYSLMDPIPGYMRVSTIDNVDGDYGRLGYLDFESGEPYTVVGYLGGY